MKEQAAGAYARALAERGLIALASDHRTQRLRRSVARVPATFDSLSTAVLITVPTLIVHSEQALAPTLARRFIGGLTRPHDELAPISGSDRFL